MKDSFVIEACAKINLFLDIISCRTDGYHELNSIMQQVSLADRLSVSVGRAGDDLVLYVDGNKADNPLLHLFKIRKCLRHTENKSVHPHRMHRHCC